ncbi:hypothetical protein KJ903_05750 [Patescibacteria group bacterium]|nr:hypothetical protein [Patescibacteria group bacterium]
MLEKADYVKIVRRPYPPLYASSIFAGILNKENYLGFISRPAELTQAIQSDYNFYYIRQERDEVGEATLRDWNSAQKIKNVNYILETRAKKLLVATRGSDVKRYLRAYARYAVAILPVQQVEEPIEREISKLLLEKVGTPKTRTILDKLNIPLRDNYYKREEYDLVTSADLVRHVKKYVWLNSRYGQHQPYQLSEAEMRLGILEKNSYLERRETEKEKIKQTITEAKKVLGSSADYLVDLMQFVVYYRTRRTDILNRSSYEAYPLLNKYAREQGLTSEQLLYCLADEVLRDDIPAKNILSERVKGYDIYVENGKLVCVHGQQSKEVRKIFAQDLGNIKKIKGVVASPGWATGRVKVVFTKKDLAEFKKGEILVTSMTTPNMVMIMHQAAAIITDEGGITCHAAIISRELQKPCIINTKIATQVLCNGEEVQVDANRGIARKLEHE